MPGLSSSFRDRLATPARLIATAAVVLALPLALAPNVVADPLGGVPDPPGTISTVPTGVGPAQPTHGAAATFANHNPESAPLGSNNFGCRPTAEHPRPVVLAHGSDSTSYSDWSALSPRLAAQGFCVFALNYGGKPGAPSFGTENIEASGVQFTEFVDRVLVSTGATKIDIVGYSQGATLTRYYINRLGGAPKVANWVGLASPTYGGILYGLVPVLQSIPGGTLAATNIGIVSPAVMEQMQGSRFITALNAGGDTVPGVRYTTIGSRVDEMIQPFENIALHGAGATNLVVQDLCPINLSGHFNMPYDPFTLQLLMNTLDPTHAQVPRCEVVPLGTGIPEVIWAAHS
ncbi:esterase/lipase family protein [Antrihabitans cavernicola]|uniref:Alpha/beta fold hydrolase n=1 Tax=Antrihabitans cavernicola TaxID=2495913 RepID=A0A5A7SFS5_9NOCA|nr:alpha/beta fold hydrolase [Spelaeibacter cavernicola]KAA0023527.1 alpha/beta fold hydrolase [Spelaeibacter cavernicola]